MADRSISVKLRAEINDFNRQMAQAGKSSDKFAADFDKNGQKIETGAGRLARSAEVNREAWQTAGSALAGFGIAGAAALALTAKAAMDWESAWTGVLKTVDGTADELTALEGALRDMALELPASSTEIAKVAETAGQLGVGIDGIESFTRTMIDLGETTNLSAEEAATALARMANIFGTSIGDVSRMGATIVDLGNNSATTEAEILGLATRLSAAGKQAGLSEANVLAFATTLTSVGVEAEAGGTALSKVFTAVGDATRDGGDDLAKFADVAGVSVAEFRAAFEDDAASAIAMFIEGMGNLAESGQSTTAVFDDLELTDQRLMRAILSTASAGELLTDQLALGNTAWEENTALVEEANKRYDTTEAKMQIARNAINDAAITIGEDFLPVLADMASAVAGAADAFSKIPDPIRRAGTGLGAITTAAALLAGGLLLVVPRIMDTYQAMQKLKAVSPGAASGLKSVGKATGALLAATVGFTALTAVVESFGSASRGGVASISETTAALLALGDAGKDLSGIFDFSDDVFGLTGNVDGLADAAGRIGDPSVVNRLQDVGGSIRGIFGKGDTSRTKAIDQIDAIGVSLATLVQSGNADKAAETFGELSAEWVKGGGTVEDLRALMPAYADALADVDNQQQLATNSAVVLTEAQQAEAEASEAAAEALQKWLTATSDAATSFSTMSGAYQSIIDGNIAAAQDQADKINAANRKRAESDESTTAAATVAWEDYYDGQKVSASEYIESLQAQVDAQRDWEANLTSISERVRDKLSSDMHAAGQEMIDELLALGPEGAAQVALIESLSRDEFRKVVELYGEQGEAAAAEFAQGLDRARTPEVSLRVNTAAGDATYSRWLDGLATEVAVDILPQFGGDANLSGQSRANLYTRNLPKHARGAIASGPQVGIWGEAGAEALVPLDRPLNMVDPSVRALSAFAQGLPQYASGGVFAPGGGGYGSPVLTSSTSTTHSPLNFYGDINTTDVADFERKAIQRKRRASLVGGRT